jgi:Kinesin motor domain
MRSSSSSSSSSRSTSSSLSSSSSSTPPDPMMASSSSSSSLQPPPTSQTDNNNNSSSSNGCAVSVAVRIRPLTTQELAAGGSAVLSTCNKNREIRLGDNRRFTYDSVFDENVSQQALYQAVSQPLLDSFMEGYNATVRSFVVSFPLQCWCLPLLCCSFAFYTCVSYSQICCLN